MPKRVFVVAAALMVLLAAVSLHAQGDSGLFFDTVDVYVVNVEVLVTDKEGNPATGLTRDDFEIYEDGKLVELSNFFAVEGRQSVLAGESAESAPAPATQRLNLVVFIDNLNMRPENRNPVFKNLRSYLEEQLDSRDRVMLVVLNDTVRVAQSFTNDVNLLLQTLDRLEKQAGSGIRLSAERAMLQRQIQNADLPPNPGNTASPIQVGLADFDSAQSLARTLGRDVVQLAEVSTQMVRASTDAIAQFTDSLAGMKGRKAVLYVSDGLALRPADAVAQAWVNKYGDWIMLQDVRGMNDVLFELTSMVGSSKYDTSDHLERLSAAASANRVAFYPLSNGGRMSRGGSVSAEFGGSGTASGQGAYSQDVIALESLSLEGSLLQLAEKTGGLAFTRTANIAGLLERMGRDFDSFYSLGYSPPHAADDEFHEIKVKVKRPDLEVRHFVGYREKDPLARLQDLTLSALHYDLEDNKLEVLLDPGEQVLVRGDQYNVSVLVKIPFGKLLLIPQAEFHTGQVSLYVIARDEGGGVSPFRRVDLPIQIPNAQILEALTQTAAYPLQLNMKSGPQRISIGVRDHLADVDSTVNLELNVGAISGVTTESSGR
ncbi:MAG: VWA domain-containing protein [bacterium]|nr:VWA domain-containing protein [bacterium]